MIPEMGMVAASCDPEKDIDASRKEERSDAVAEARLEAVLWSKPSVSEKAERYSTGQRSRSPGSSLFPAVTVLRELVAVLSSWVHVRHCEAENCLRNRHKRTGL